MTAARPPRERRSGASRRLIPELLLTLGVVLGFVNIVYRFVIDGKLPQPFIFDINDTFMDWFNTAYYAHNRGAFDVWRTVYPPWSFVFLKLVGIPYCYASNAIRARDCDVLGISAILASYLLGAALAALAFWRADQRTALFRGLSFAIGLPLLFTLERGNLILPCFVFFVLAHGNISRSRWVRAIGIAVTINFKPYLLLPALALMFKRRWRMLEIAGFASVLLYLLSFAIMASGSPLELLDNVRSWVQFTGTLPWEQIYYSTSFAPFLEFGTNRFPTHEFLSQPTIDPFLYAIPIVINASRALALATFVGTWLQPKALATSRVSLLLLAASLVGQSPGGYTETFLVFLLFLERWERPGPIIAIAMGYLLCVPYDFVLARIIELTGDSWLSGRTISSAFGISAGIFLRPGFIVVMFWALALDSLLVIARAHRRDRPTLALSPGLVPA